MNTSPKKRRADLAIEYGVTLRTIDRWKRDGTLKRPRRMKQPYWTEEQIRQSERIQFRKWSASEKLRALKASKLRKHRIAAKIQTGQIIPNQLVLL